MFLKPKYNQSAQPLRPTVILKVFKNFRAEWVLCGDIRDRDNQKQQRDVTHHTEGALLSIFCAANKLLASTEVQPPVSL